MSITADYPDNISNLRHLKRLSPKRRVYAGIDQSLDDLPEDDFSGTGLNLPPMPDAPIPDAGNFDVRANPVLPVDELGSEDGEEQDNALYRLGKGLGEMAKEKSESNMPPPVDWSKLVAQHRELDPNWNPPKEIAERVPGEVAPQIPPPEEFISAAPKQETIPPVVASTEAESAQQPVQEEKEPGTYVELGATSQAFSTPQVQQEISRIFGEVTPEMMRQAEEMEKAIDAELKGLSDIEASQAQVDADLRQNIKDRNLTTGQKIAMAIALLAPALVGGIFGGAEGLLGALGGGGEAVAKNLLNREKLNKEDQEALVNLGMSRAKIGTQKLETTLKGKEIRQKLLENVGDPKLRALVKDNLGIVKNENGQEELVIDTGNPLIPLKTSYVRDESDYKQFKNKVLPQLKTRLGNTEQALKLINQLDEMVNIAQSQRYIPGGGVVKAFVPKLQEEMIDTATGKPVRISKHFETLREQLSDLYGQTVGTIGAKQAPASYREHFLKILPNPFDIKSLYRGEGDLDTIKAQINSVKDKFEENLTESFAVHGVETTPIKKMFSSSPYNVSRSEMIRKRSKAEEEAAKYK